MGFDSASPWSGASTARRTRLVTAVGLASALVVSTAAVGAGGGPASADQASVRAGQHNVAGAADPAVISDWNATAVATLITDAVRSPAESYVYFAFTHNSHAQRRRGNHP